MSETAEEEPTLCSYFETHKPTSFTDYTPPHFLPTSTPPHHPQGHRRYIAIYEYYDGGCPSLIYLEYDGNQEAIQSLQYIASHNNDESYDVSLLTLGCPRLIPETVVDELLEVQGEELGRLLRENLPVPKVAENWADGAPGGWGDGGDPYGCAMWVEQLVQRRLDGQIAVLPLQPPEGCPDEYSNYAVHLFSYGQQLQDYIRPWSSPEMQASEPELDR